VVDEGEKVTAHPAHVLGGDGQHRAGADGSIGCGAAGAEQRNPG